MLNNLKTKEKKIQMDCDISLASYFMFLFLLKKRGSLNKVGTPPHPHLSLVFLFFGSRPSFILLILVTF